jgi:predicted transcriptional regulator
MKNRSTITMKIGIASREQIKRRTIEIAAGRIKRNADDPKLWFTSFNAILRVLSDKNMLLLEMIRNSEPDSLTDLAEMSGQKKSNLSRTLHKLEKFGLVEFEEGAGRRKKPRVHYDSVAFERLLANSEAA